MIRSLIAGTLVVAVAACSPEATSNAGSGNPTVSATPAATAGASISGAPATVVPSTVPSLAPSSGAPSPSTGVGTLSVIPPGSAIEVAVAELNLRETPSTAGRRIEVLERGETVIVSPYDGVWFGAGPVKRDGYTWYPVMKLHTPDLEGNLPALPIRPILLGAEVDGGWIATDNGEASYVAQVPPRCPTTVDLAHVEAMLSAERLACFNGPIVLEGTFGWCPACAGELSGDFEPAWLTYLQLIDFLSVKPSEQIGPILLRFPPEGPGKPAIGSIIRVTVHVDDPAAAGCSMTVEEAPPVPAATAVLYCREQVVVDSYEIIGTDPNFGT